MTKTVPPPPARRSGFTPEVVEYLTRRSEAIAKAVCGKGKPMSYGHSGSKNKS